MGTRGHEAVQAYAPAVIAIPLLIGDDRNIVASLSRHQGAEGLVSHAHPSPKSGLAFT
jgi:hypothetical protein